MDITLRIVLLVISFLFLAYVLVRVRRGKYLLKYSLVWILLSILGIFSAIFPVWLFELANVLGFSIPSNFVYFALIAFLFVLNIILSGIISRQEMTLKTIIQELSLIKAQQRHEEDDKRNCL